MALQIAPIPHAKRLVNLVKGDEYEVNLYPSNEKVPAKYLGMSESEIHVFESSDKYIFADNHWVTREGNKVSYTPISSAPIAHVNKELLKSQIGYSILFNILQSAGVKL